MKMRWCVSACSGRLNHSWSPRLAVVDKGRRHAGLAKHRYRKRQTVRSRYTNTAIGTPKRAANFAASCLLMPRVPERIALMVP